MRQEWGLLRTQREVGSSSTKFSNQDSTESERSRRSALKRASPFRTLSRVRPYRASNLSAVRQDEALSLFLFWLNRDEKWRRMMIISKSMDNGKKIFLL